MRPTHLITITCWTLLVCTSLTALFPLSLATETTHAAVSNVAQAAQIPEESHSVGKQQEMEELAQPPSPNPDNVNDNEQYIAERTARWAESMDNKHQKLADASDVASIVSLLQDASISPQEKLMLLETLQVLVEPIDIANDLHKVGGLAPIINFLAANDQTLAKAAARVLSTAASNNVEFQEQLLKVYPNIMQLLLAPLSPTFSSSNSNSINDDRQGKAGLYDMQHSVLVAAASILRNNADARQSFAAAGGSTILVQLIEQQQQQQQQQEQRQSSGGKESGKLQRRALSLITDLAYIDPTLLDTSSAVRVVLQVLQQYEDLDMCEKSLLAIEALLTIPAGEKALKKVDAAGMVRVVEGILKESHDALAEDVLDVAMSVRKQLEGDIHEDL